MADEEFAPTRVNDGVALVATAVFSGMAGSWMLSRAKRMSTPAKTWIAIGTGLGGGFLVSRFNRPVGWGIAAGLGGLGLMALIAQFAGVIESGRAFGFETDSAGELAAPEPKYSLRRGQPPALQVGQTRLRLKEISSAIDGFR